MEDGWNQLFGPVVEKSTPKKRTDFTMSSTPFVRIFVYIDVQCSSIRPPGSSEQRLEKSLPSILPTPSTIGIIHRLSVARQLKGQSTEPPTRGILSSSSDCHQAPHSPNPPSSLDCRSLVVLDLAYYSG